MLDKRAWIAVAVMAAACGDNLSARPDAVEIDARPPPDADYGAVPRVETVPCRFEVPASLGLAEGTGYACGDLVVVENRETQQGRIRLHFIRVKSEATTNRGTIYLDGGPGGDGSGMVLTLGVKGPEFLAGLLVDGDFLVIGQRGTRKSLPWLECDQGCDPTVADLTAYNTAFNADDVDELRSTLGLDKLNLYGISYGSRLALEVMRRHGEHVRAAVIEGLVPAQVKWSAAIPASFYSALQALNASCAASGACGSTYGNLVDKLVSGVYAVDTEPVAIPTSTGDVELDGYRYAYIVFRMLYARSMYPWLPLLINDMAIRRTDRIGAFVGAWLDAEAERDNRIARGLYYSVVCSELYNPYDPSARQTANAGVPQDIIEIMGGSDEGLAVYCAQWPKASEQLAAQLAQPVTSAVRTLVSSGDLDPITPPSYGAVAAQSLSNKLVIDHANSGHGATLQSSCATGTLLAFLADPDATLDTSCASTIATTYVMPTMATRVPLPDRAVLRAEQAIAPAFPMLPR